MNAAVRAPRGTRVERLLAGAVVLLLLPVLLSGSTWRLLAHAAAAPALALLAIGAGLAWREARDEPRALRLLAVVLMAVFGTLFAASVLRLLLWLAIYNG